MPSDSAPALSQSLATNLWRQNQALAARILAHPFVRGLGDGSLPKASFRRYVAQDAYFLEAFARAYAVCLATSHEREDLYDFAGLIGGVIEELRLHAGYAALWKVELEGVVPNPATLAYTNFLATTAARGSIGETAAAMTPCMRLYAFLGQSLARGPVADPYAEWIRTYAAPEFETLAARLEAVLDRHARDLPPIHTAYRQAMLLELEFFAACHAGG